MLYTIVRYILKIYYKIVYFYSAEGVENIPKQGGMLICGNHKHFNDPLVILASIKQQPKFLAKEELFKIKPFGWFLRKCGCVSVDRSHGDIKALRTCLKILSNEQTMIMFPEGTRFATSVDDVKQGAILFAVKSKVPIIPVGLSRLKPFSKTKVRFGKPIYYTDYYDKKMSTDEYKKLADSLMLDIYNLVDEKCCYYDELKASVENEN